MADATSTNPPAGKLRELPSRFSPPLVGDTLAFMKDPQGLLMQCTRELGPVFKLRILGDDVACFVGPEAFSLFLDERYFTRADGSPKHLQAIFGHGAVPFLAGQEFKVRKQLLMRVFEERALDSYAPTIERIIRRYARRWSELGAFAWAPEITAMCMTAANALFLGANPDADDPRFEEAFAAATEGILSVPVKLPFTKFGKALRARDFILERIAEAIDSHEKSPRDDAMARALAARADDGSKLSRDELQTETFHFFGAYMPVIGGLTLLAMLLAQNPDVVKRLREEIVAKLPEGPLTVAKLRQLEYLDCVCKESRRVQPIVPITFFANVVAECAYKDIRIPSAIKAFGCIAPTLLDPKTFPEPKRFDPDRWAGGRATDRMNAAWVPHGGGVHLVAHRCAGEQLANLMMKAFAVLLLREHEWSLPPQDTSIIPGGLFAMPRSGLDVRFKRLTQPLAQTATASQDAS